MNKQETIDFLRSLIRTRRRLIKKDAGRKNRDAMDKAADFIEIHLDAHEHKYTRAGLARFFVKYQNIIRSLIPGPGSRSHDKLMRDFNRHLFLCKVEYECNEIDKEIQS